MKRTTALLSLGLALMATAQAQAGDWNNGAGVVVRDSGGMAGVPVPAPVPSAESFHWYVRADLGYAFKSSGSVDTTTGLGASFKANYDDGEGPFHGGIGFGRYVTPTFRWDMTGEYRGSQKVGNSSHSYTAQTVTPGPSITLGSNTFISNQINTYNGVRSQEDRMANHTILMNAYHDFNRGGTFNPYLGVGFGAVVREGKSHYQDKAHCVYTVNDANLPIGPQACSQPDFAKSGTPSSSNFGAAAAVMAGGTYEVSKGILLDTGYRATWQGGDTSLRPSVGESVIGGSRIDHEFRTGLRWNIW